MSSEFIVPDDWGAGSSTLRARGAVTRFDARIDDVSLNQQVSSALLGMDQSGEHWTLDAVLTRSRSDAGFFSGTNGDGRAELDLTGIFPWGQYRQDDRLSVWGMPGYGEGTMTLDPEGEKPIDTGIDLAVAAVGVKSAVTDPHPRAGLALSIKSDAVVVRASSERASYLLPLDVGTWRLDLTVQGALRGSEPPDLARYRPQKSGSGMTVVIRTEGLAPTSASVSPYLTVATESGRRSTRGN